jgi:GAF domain-containing protein
MSMNRTGQRRASEEALERLVEEQAALRRVATQVAQGVPPEDIFAAVSDVVGRLVGTDSATVMKFDDDGPGIIFVGVASKRSSAFPLGARWKFEDGMASAEVYRTGRSARSTKDWSEVEGTVGETHHRLGIVSAVASPIVVEGRLWGAMAVQSQEQLPRETEERLERFTELVATAIANAESRTGLTRLAEEQAALRRVATLVAQGVRPDEIFAAVSDEVGRLFGTDSATVVKYDDEGAGIVFVGVASRVSGAFPLGAHWPFREGMASAEVYRTGRSARTGAHLSTVEGPIGDVQRRLGIMSSVASPIVVEGRRWGAVAVQSQWHLPLDTEERLEKFTELLATAIANAESRAALTRLAEEQAALRRVATLVARGVNSGELFAAVSDEVGRLVGTDSATVIKYDDDGEGIIYVGSASKVSGAFPVGVHWKFQEGMASYDVYRTGHSARSGAHLITVDGPIGDTHRRMGIISAVASPIVVEGRLWGAMAVHGHQPLPPDTEERVEKFTELVATAIANAESRAGLTRLAEEQAALRRVATLVARGAPPAELFAAVTEEAGQLLPVDGASMGRYDPDGMFTTIATWNSAAAAFPVGKRWIPEGKNIMTLVLETGRPARMDTYAEASGPIGVTGREAGFRSSVGTPIVVEGRLWGALTVASSAEQPLPAGTEARLESFTELVATAIANAESRAALGRLAEQQAALKRVATLVAEGVPPAKVFSALSEEVSLLLDAEATVIGRLEADGRVTVLAVSGTASDQSLLGTQFEPEPETVLAAVVETGHSGRNDDYSNASDPARSLGIRSGVGVPIVVEGALWGVVAIGTVRERFPDDTAQRLEEFTELAATAIANAESRSELKASRVRIVAASDEARRRIERDLHDGTQQRLVSLGLALRLAETSVPPELGEVRAELSRAASGLSDAVEDLQEISRGIHPAILSKGGLGPALSTLTHRSAIPVQLDSDIDERLPEPIEVAAYYVVSEALANATKHANASRLNVKAATRDGHLRLWIRDDGVGGADPTGGSGLVGLRDRVEALGGSIEISSPPGQGTHLAVQLPLQLDLTADESEESLSARLMDSLSAQGPTLRPDVRDSG